MVLTVTFLGRCNDPILQMRLRESTPLVPGDTWIRAELEYEAAPLNPKAIKAGIAP